MEAFLYQQQQQNFLLDPESYNMIPSSPIGYNSLPPLHGDQMSNASSSCFTGYNSPDPCMHDASTTTSPTPQPSPQKKRKQSTDVSSLSTSQSKGTMKGSSKGRRKKGSGEKVEEEASKTKATNYEEPPSGYIHVRARRGQATDSHSLAERVRRERISERMKKLQGLVPGCDKVIGKALVLDEIINYVQSLQNQVEFLSMRLASVNPILYDFGGGFEDYMSQAEEMGSISQSIPSVIQSSHIPPTAFEAATSSLQQQQQQQQVIDPAATFSLHGQGSHPFSQGSSSFLMQVGLSNMCTFQ